MKNEDLERIHISETELAEVKEILGKTAKGMTDEQIRYQVASIKYLAESWLDEYEKSIFDGKTLTEKISAY